MRIFDCFTFYNELDLLELRLRELYNHVDHFVIVESNQTFTNRPKNYIFEMAKARFAPWKDKIRYIKHKSRSHHNPWDNETEQRNAIMDGLYDADPSDIAIISDVDEIPRAAAVDYMREHNTHIYYGLRMPLFNFKFNYMRTTPGQYDVWAMGIMAGYLNDNVTPNFLRNQRFELNVFPYQHNDDQICMVEHAGWHFGYLGDNEYLKDKAQSFSHQEVNTPEFLANIDVAKSIAEGKEWDRSQPNQYQVVRATDYFPADIDKFLSFILDHPDGNDPLDFLPPFAYNK